jgi:hypothetical protein
MVVARSCDTARPGRSCHRLATRLSRLTQGGAAAPPPPLGYTRRAPRRSRGDLYFYSVDHNLRDKLDQIDGDRCPVVVLTGTMYYLTTPDDGRGPPSTSRTGSSSRWRTSATSPWARTTRSSAATCCRRSSGSVHARCRARLIAASATRFPRPGGPSAQGPPGREPVAPDPGELAGESEVWARQGSNLRPLACKARALPLSYAPFGPLQGVPEPAGGPRRGSFLRRPAG